MTSGNLRIALSGPVGSGKTTLGQALAGRLGLPFIPEDYRNIYSTHAASRKILRDPLAPGTRKKEATRALMDSFSVWLAEREKLYGKHPGFVADRWEADTLDLWLKFLANTADCDGETRKVWSRLQAVGESLSFAVLLPPAPVPVETRNEDGLRRKQSFTLTLQAWIMTGGLIRQCRNLPVLELPAVGQNLGERLDAVLCFIRDRFPDAAVPA